MTEKLKTALHCAEKGIQVFPVAGVRRDGSCACPKGKDCEHTGKHPVLSGSWKRYATTDINKIKEWFSHDLFNLAIVIPKSILVIDIDPKNGGLDTLKSFESEHGTIGNSVDVETGSGGQHRFFWVPDKLMEQKIKNRELLKGIDVKAEGGYVVGVGSDHKSGRVYKSLSKNGFNLDELKPLQNGQLISLIMSKTKNPTLQQSKISAPRKVVDVGFTGGKVIEGSRNNFLFTTACSLRAKGFFHDQILGVLKKINVEFCTPQLTEYEVAQCAESSARYSIGREKIKPTYKITDPCFYGPIGEAVKAIADFTESSAMAVLVTLLNICGSAIGRRVYLKLGGITIRSNLFSIIVGSSAKGRKGTSFSISKVLAEKFIEPAWFGRVQSGIASGEGIINAIKDPEKFNQAKEDQTPSFQISEDKRLFLFEAELGRVFKAMKRDGNTVSQILRQAWDGGNIQTLTKMNPQIATKPHVSLLGHITKFELNAEVCSNDIFNGFVNRCLWIYSERERLLPLGGRSIEFLELKDLADAFQLKDIPSILELDKDAEPLWIQIYQSENMDLEFPDERQSAIEARGTDQILRMALIYAVADKSPVVRIEHLQAAFSIWKFSKLSSAYALGVVDVEGGRHQEKILRLLEVNQSVSRTQIRDTLHRNVSAHEIDKIRERLVEQGRIKVEHSQDSEFWVNLNAANAVYN